MIISIHQPEAFPYTGFFSKMLKSDIFVYLDDVQFTKNNFQNRNRIIRDGEAKWLTIPVKMKGHLSSTIKDMKVADEKDWRKNILNLIRLAYSNCNFYEAYINELEKLINDSYSSSNLIDFNISFIDFVRKNLGIKNKVYRSSSFELSGYKKGDLILEICKRFYKEGTPLVYLSGLGGMNYLDKFKFAINNIGIAYQSNYRYPYPQKSDIFQPYASILDILMNLGNEGTLEYLHKNFEYVDAIDKSIITIP